jgi:2-dehydro-3-deoxygalactonokinase
VSQPGQPALAAADWGTSNLRVWLLDRTGALLAERKSGDGMLTAGAKGFANILEGHLAAMGAPAKLPVVVCGMAGARQGWVEAGYLDVPARIADFASASTPAPDTARPVRILPGLAQRRTDAPDVMRGEETQLAGAGLGAGNHLVCMPGTHSKWVGVEAGKVTGFRTAMTGELFHVISTHSILRHSVGEPPDAGDASAPAFRDTLLRAIAAPQDLTSMLFHLRAGVLLHDMPKTEAAARLSGMLIGVEIAAARSATPTVRAVTLVASGPIGERYEAALRLGGYDVAVVDADVAVRAGLFAAGARLYLDGTSS